MNTNTSTVAVTKLNSLISSFLILAGLCYSNVSFAKHVSDPEKVTISPPTHDEDARDYVNKFALMSLFAKTAYRKDIHDADERKLFGCDYKAKPPTDFPKSIHWKRWDGEGSCYNHDGLYYETYVHTNEQKLEDMAVIAIRGTEASSFADWKANISGFIPFHNSEYIEAKKTMIPLITRLQKSGITKIYLTGHSLGGGVAQEIAYMSNDVTETYTFDTSPVTGWVRQHLEGNTPVKNPKIYRVYMSNEVLSYIRNFTHHFNYKLPKRIDYQFNYEENGLLKDHNMSYLTCNFAKHMTEDDTIFDYSKLDAQAVLKNPDLCPVDF